ncbi:MAG: heavy-metal-associated domain-containing protein [Polyangiaceae bacterium]|jgi:Cu+-exporting ATPase|nr:heavy-metal-associated domain-containing protein [Polyangiaceae bacterium]
MTGNTSEFLVAGMTCQACVRRVQRAIEGLDGVRSVQIDLASGRVTVEHEPARQLEGVAQAIQRSGYRMVGTGTAS